MIPTYFQKFYNEIDVNILNFLMILGLIGLIADFVLFGFVFLFSLQNIRYYNFYSKDLHCLLTTDYG